MSDSQPAEPTEPFDARLRKTKKLGQILVEEGLISPADLEQALLQQSRDDQPLGRILISLGLVRESDLVAALAKQIGFRFVDLGDYTVDASAAALISEQVARRYRALPIGHEDNKLIVAMADPANLFALDDIRTLTGSEVQPVVATASDIDAAIRKYSRLDQSVQAMASEASIAIEDDLAEMERAAAAVEEGPIVKMVNLLISRLKVMADINIAERRIPQDGRVGLTVAGKTIDLRLATLPTVYGEKVVIRVLDKSSVLLRLEDLGFGETAFHSYQRSYTKPYGAILVTGPTGSGKSTTLYATLNIVNKPDRNIITVEDPVEYRLPGINQIQVNPRAGLTFASALRSILRADPDIILIGEIRDRETAMIAIESALTGHLVLSSVHTNDAPSSLPRLVEMGVETYLVASAIDCVVAQRLARKLCGKCKQGYKPESTELEGAGFPEEAWPEITELFRATGCAACAKTGYRGRMGLYEVMPVTEEIERMTVDRVSTEELRRSAKRSGMVALREDGLAKVRAGQTSLQEILRVVA